MKVCDTKHSGFCNGLDIRQVQMKGRHPGKPNVYDGAIVNMCKGCRELQNGSFKFIKIQK